MEIKILTTKEEILKQFKVLKELYPSLTEDELSNDLNIMLSCNYKQAAVFEGEDCLGLSGFWINKKLWCGKYLEIDNFIVLQAHRSKGIGQMIIDFLHDLAIIENCNIITLDSYKNNVRAHQLFEANQFDAKGIHFVRFINKNAIR